MVAAEQQPRLIRVESSTDPLLADVQKPEESGK
jgi:hypothetical protein